MHPLFLVAGSWFAAFSQITAETDITSPPAPALFLGALILLLASLWWWRWCIRGQDGARTDIWRVCQEAEQRAETLLRENVAGPQYRCLLDTGYLEVPSRLHPGRIYRLPARPGRVEVYEDGKWIAQLCVIACDPVPHADLVLAQKWMIEADEQAYLATANWIHGPPRQHIRPLRC